MQTPVGTERRFGQKRSSQFPMAIQRRNLQQRDVLRQSFMGTPTIPPA